MRKWGRVCPYLQADIEWEFTAKLKGGGCGEKKTSGLLKSHHTHTLPRLQKNQKGDKVGQDD